MYCLSYIAEKPFILTLTLKFGRCIKKLGKFRQSTQVLLKALDVYNIITKFHEYIKNACKTPPGPGVTIENFGVFIKPCTPGPGGDLHAFFVYS